MASNSWREEPYWHWDWPGRPQGYVQQGNGMNQLERQEPPRGTWVSDLLVPDPESRSGWRQHFIYRDPPQPPPGRRAGFR